MVKGFDCSSTNHSVIRRICNPEDQESWVEFVDIYALLIRQYALGHGLQSADADDVTQKVFDRLYRKISSYDPERGRFRDWLRKVAQNVIFRSLRRTNSPDRPRGGDAVSVLDHQESNRMWDEQFCAHILQSALHLVRSDFDSVTWQAFEETWKDVPPQEVARNVGKPVGWVYKAKFQVKQRLHEAVLIIAEDDLFFS